MFLLGVAFGIMIGFGLRIMYNLITGKDIPLYNFKYTTDKDGSLSY